MSDLIMRLSMLAALMYDPRPRATVNEAKAELERLRAENDRLSSCIAVVKTEADGANARARLMFDAKEHWRERAERAEAAIAAAQQQAEPAPGYCKHCKQYTIEEQLPQPRITAEQAEELKRLVDALRDTMKWLNDERWGTWPYMEGAQVYEDRALHASKIDALLRKYDGEKRDE